MYWADRTRIQSRGPFRSRSPRSELVEEAQKVVRAQGWRRSRTIAVYIRIARRKLDQEALKVIGIEEWGPGRTVAFGVAKRDELSGRRQLRVDPPDVLAPGVPGQDSAVQSRPRRPRGCIAAKRHPARILTSLVSNEVSC